MLEPAARTASALQPRGSNQIGLAEFNERVVLHAIRLHGALPKAELARLTRLSSQTVALIINRLLEKALVLKEAPVRGKIGQPSVPIALNPDGAFAVGVKIGRRSLDVLLVDFSGRVRARSNFAYDFPDPAILFREIGARIEQVCAALRAQHRARVCGVGVAAPLSLGGWQSLLGVASAQAARWEQVDIAASVQAATRLPVQLAKDTAAACAAELVAGHGRTIKSYLYVFVDTFIGGALVLNSQLYAGAHGNAGAMASLPLPAAHSSGGLPRQLLSAASLLTLERLYIAQALDPAAITDARAMQAPWRAHTLKWCADAGGAIALGAHVATCVLDIEHVVVDGLMDRAVLAELLAQTHRALDTQNWEGVVRPMLLAGTIGADARALGGALLPLYANFAPDQDLFLKSA